MNFAALVVHSCNKFRPPTRDNAHQIIGAAELPAKGDDWELQFQRAGRSPSTVRLKSERLAEHVCASWPLLYHQVAMRPNMLSINDLLLGRAGQRVVTVGLRPPQRPNPHHMEPPQSPPGGRSMHSQCWPADGVPPIGRSIQASTKRTNRCLLIRRKRLRSSGPCWPSRQAQLVEEHKAFVSPKWVVPGRTNLIDRAYPDILNCRL